MLDQRGQGTCSPVGKDFLYVFKPAPQVREPDHGRTANSLAPYGLTASGLGCTDGPPATCRWTGCERVASHPRWPQIVLAWNVVMPALADCLTLDLRR